MHEIAVKTTAAKWPRNTHHYGGTSELKLRRRRILSILCLVNHKSHVRVKQSVHQITTILITLHIIRHFMLKEDLEKQQQTNKQKDEWRGKSPSLAADKACETIFWPPPGIICRTFDCFRFSAK